MPPCDVLEDEAAMTPQELCAALRLKMSAFYKYQASGRFERFELAPRIGPRRYSRKLVQAYLNREDTGIGRLKVVRKVG